MKKILLLAIPVAAILPFLFSTARAQAPKIHFDSRPEVDVIGITFGQSLKPRVRFIPGESCWELDLNVFPPIRLDEDLITYRGPVKLLWVSPPQGDSSVQTLTIYVQHGTEMTMREIGKDVQFLFRKPASGTGEPHGSHSLKPQPLLVPESVSVGGGIDVEVNDASPLPILSELAKGAGIGIRFRDAPPARVTLRVKEDSCLRGLQKVAEQMGMVFTQEGAIHWITDKRNSLLLFPSKGGDPEGDGSGSSLREVIRARMGKTLGDELCKRLPTAILDRVPDPRKFSRNPREFVQTLLQSHGVKYEDLKTGSF